MSKKSDKELTSNIIQFPCSHNVRPQSIEDVLETVMDVKFCHIEESLEMLMPQIFNQIGMLGFQYGGTEEYNFAGAMIYASVRSFMMLYHDIEHPFQQIQDKIFYTTEEDDVMLQPSFTENPLRLVKKPRKPRKSKIEKSNETKKEIC